MGTSKPRVITKYPNRRLYDTDESRYITLDDIRRLVVEELPFVVIDKKTDANITRRVLLQVISEQEHNGDSVFTVGFLTQVIRCQEQSDAPALAATLESSLRRYITELQSFSSTDSINPLTGNP